MSPDDVVNASKLFETLGLPLRYSILHLYECTFNCITGLGFRLRVFESGVLVVQSLSHSEEAIIKESERLVLKKKLQLSAGSVMIVLSSGEGAQITHS